MHRFTLGFACGLGLAVAVGAGLATAQGLFPPASGTAAGIPPGGRSFGVGCVDAQGLLDNSRRAVVLRPQGRQDSPDLYVSCQPAGRPR